MWPIDQLAREVLASPAGAPAIDFRQPAGAPALLPPDSLTWRIMKNPIALLVGGIAAVILELAEPRVRAGVWTYTRFRDDPAGRIRRTGYAAMATVYAPADAARALIARVNAMHARVRGVTPAGVAFAADDPELLTWVQATAGYGFIEAYHRFARPLNDSERDLACAEAAETAALYGVTEPPLSATDVDALFERMRPKLERSDIVFEFLDIMRRAPLLPSLTRPLQGLAVSAAIDLVPDWTRDVLGLEQENLSGAGATLLRAMGGVGERLVLKDAPPAQACARLGLPADYLYRRA